MPQKKAIEALECAAYLCPDQFNGAGREELRILMEYNVPDLPKSVEEIDFRSNYAHRRYTHLGWNPVVHPELGNWEKRKTILISAVSKVFGSIDTKLCDSFAALLYYIHILSDIESIDTYAKYRREGSYVLPLARHEASETQPDILRELIVIYLPVLFSKQIDSDDYKQLISKLEDIAVKARSLASTTGGINSEEKYTLYHDYVVQVLDVMSGYIPKLLHKEPYFVRVFPELY